MNLYCKRVLALFVAVVIAMLPFRFGHAVDGSDMPLKHPCAKRAGSICDHGHDTHARDPCAEFAHDEASSNDCCEDQCSGGQVLVSTTIDLRLSPSRGFKHLRFTRVPEVPAFAKYRPPTFIS